MTNSFIMALLESGIRFLGKHALAETYMFTNRLDFWDQYGSVKFSLADGVWQSENKGYANSIGGIQHMFDGLKKISFQYSTSTEGNYDSLCLYINGEQKLRVSGEIGWTDFLWETNGPIEDCLVEIFYSKDGSVSRGSDTVWIRDLKIDTEPVHIPLNEGWSLFHQFASQNNNVAYAKEKTIAGVSESINTTAELDAAGIAHSTTTINTTQYTLVDNYMQAYYVSSPYGFVEMDLPDGYNKVLVEYGNWYNGTVYLYIGGEHRQTLVGNSGAAVYEGTYSQGDKLRIEESGIFWVKAIWVR